MINLIAPAGFQYASIAQPIGTAPAAFNRDYWLTDKVMGRVEGRETEMLPGITGADATVERQKLDALLTRMRTLSWWMLEKGTEEK